MQIRATTLPCPHCCGNSSGNCSLECQSMAASARKCGYDPLTGFNGRKFKSLRKTGTLYRCEFDNSSCVNSSGGSQTISWFGQLGPVGSGTSYALISAVGTVTKTQASPPRYTFSLTATVTYPLGGRLDGLDLGSFLAGHPTHYHIGYDTYGPTTQTVTATNVDVGTDNMVKLDGGWGIGGHAEFVQTAPLTGIGQTKNSIRDDWDFTGLYSPSGGSCPAPAETDNTARHSQSYGDCPLASGGTLQTPGPVESDYAGLASDVTTETTRNINGLGSCISVGGGTYVKLTGSLSESLTQEDTSQDAIDRVTPGLTWSGSGCVSSIQQPDATGTFGFMKSRVRATFRALTVGKDYAGYILFQQRSVGSADNWTTYGQQVIDFTAEGPTETTAWVDVPLVDGMEIRAATCYAVPL